MECRGPFLPFVPCGLTPVAASSLFFPLSATKRFRGLLARFIIGGRSIFSIIDEIRRIIVRLIGWLGQKPKAHWLQVSPHPVFHVHFPRFVFKIKSFQLLVGRIRATSGTFYFMDGLPSRGALVRSRLPRSPRAF